VRNISTHFFVVPKYLLLLDPTANVDAIKSPLPAHLECGQLALLRNPVNGLPRNLKQLGDPR
jgi:hypothetical protein